MIGSDARSVKPKMATSRLARCAEFSRTSVLVQGLIMAGRVDHPIPSRQGIWYLEPGQPTPDQMAGITNAMKTAGIMINVTVLLLRSLAPAGRAR
jgi:hypothetical protein